MALILDVETTGFPRSKIFTPEDVDKFPRIVQLSMMLCNEQLERVEMFDFIINREGMFVIENSNIHGITDEISDTKGISFSSVLDIVSLCLNRVYYVIAHNASFDVPILQSELFRFNRIDLAELLGTKRVICTMNQTRLLVNAKNKIGRLKNPTLGELYNFALNKPMENAHNALYDVINLHEVVYHLFVNKIMDFGFGMVEPMFKPETPIFEPETPIFKPEEPEIQTEESVIQTEELEIQTEESVIQTEESVIQTEESEILKTP